MKRFSSLYAFYSWNGDIEREELEEQMRAFGRAKALRDIFIHARAGLEIPYFGRTGSKDSALPCRSPKN